MMHKLKNILLTLVVAAFSFNHASSQTWEAGLMAGGSNYMGDFAPYPILEESHASTGLFLQYNLNSYISLDGSFNYGSISGDDKNLDYLNSRNLSFRSHIYELSLQMEYNFYPFAVGIEARNYTPFFFTGLSGFYFNPTTQYNGEKVELQPLSTEGQGLEGGPETYSNFNAAVPIGLGFKMDVSPNWIMGIKGGVRVTFTDYLDDVSGTYFSPSVLAEEVGPQSAELADRSSGENALGRPGKQRGGYNEVDYFMFLRFVLSFRIKNPDCFEF